MSRPSTKSFIDSLDDTTPAWRVFMLDTRDDGSTDIVCSHLLTERAAVRREHEADKSRRPISVLEDSLIRYRKLAPGENVRASFFLSHSELGTISMFWELLSRARDRRLESTP